MIITGSTSMLGLALIDVCLSKGTETVAVLRHDSVKKGRLPKSGLLHAVECDISQLSDLASMIDGPFDAFYHFAWMDTDGRSRNNIASQSGNIAYALDAVRLAKRLDCKKFIGAGSQAEYGRVDGVISEERSVSPDSAYGIAKYAAGRLSSILCEQLGMGFAWSRIFSTYGANDMPSTMVMYCIRSLLNGEKPSLTPCGQVWDYLYCADAAQAFYLIGEKGRDQTVYNIGSGQARPLREYVMAIRDAIDPSLPLGIGEREYAFRQVMRLCPDITALQEDTGFRAATPFERGIAATIDWCKKEMPQ